MSDEYVYLHARNKQRFRYNVSMRVFETCYLAKRTLINSICGKQWGNWQAIDSYLYPSLITRLKDEVLSLEGKAIYNLNHW